MKLIMYICFIIIINDMKEKEIIEKIANRMELLGISQYKLSGITGVSKPMLSRYFRGMVDIPLCSLVKITKA